MLIIKLDTTSGLSWCYHNLSTWFAVIYSPLHVAAKWGRVNLVKLLLENGAVIDCRTRDLLTPLHCAARSGHDLVVDLLLEKQAPIGAKTKNGLAPLHMSAQGKYQTP